MQAATSFLVCMVANSRALLPSVSVSLMLASWSSRNSTWKRSRLGALWEIQESQYLLELVYCLTIYAFIRDEGNCTVLTCPFLAARWRGVVLALSIGSTSAPASSSAANVLVMPQAAAQSIGVQPNWEGRGLVETDSKQLKNYGSLIVKPWRHKLFISAPSLPGF